MTETRFKVVFTKLAEASEDQDGMDLLAACDELQDDVDEVSELRRLALALREPDTPSYTST